MVSVSLLDIASVIGRDCLSARGIADRMGLEMTSEQVQVIRHECEVGVEFGSFVKVEIPGCVFYRNL